MAASVFFKTPLNYVTPLGLLQPSCELVGLSTFGPALGFRHCDVCKGSPDTWPGTLPRTPGEDAEAADPL